MDDQSLVTAAREHGAPYGDGENGPTFRIAARLKDGLYLPCVLVAGAERQLALAERRLEEEREGRGSIGYRDTLAAFVTKGHRLAVWDVDAVEPSPFAIPVDRLREVKGETSMGWTQFGAVMADGTRCEFGTTYYDAFFEMPPGYTGADVRQILPVDRSASKVWREKPFFWCYAVGL